MVLVQSPTNWAINNIIKLNTYNKPDYKAHPCSGYSWIERIFLMGYMVLCGTDRPRHALPGTPFAYGTWNNRMTWYVWEIYIILDTRLKSNGK